jgi:hypothetical protein
MKTKYKTVILVAFFIIFFALITMFIVGVERFEYGFSNQYLLKIYPNKSESYYAVVYNEESKDGDAQYLGVIDERKKESNLIILGPLYSIVESSSALKFQRIVFSEDGSVIASESDIKIQERKMSFWLAYDFENSVSYWGKSRPRSEDPNMTEIRGKAIQELLQSRGGIGQEFRDLGLFNKENKLSYWEWKRWVKQFRQAIQRSRQWTPADIGKQSN